MNVPRTVLTSLIAAAVAGAVAVTALAGSATIKPPANIAKAGKDRLVLGHRVSAVRGVLQGHRRPVGSDIDIASGIARLWA